MARTKAELEAGLSMIKRWAKVNEFIIILNEINSNPDDCWISIRPEILDYVDRAGAAKGLLSLLLEESGAIRAKAEELGIDLPLDTRHGTV